MYLAPIAHCLYSLDECVAKTSGGQTEPKTCSYIRFPTHSQPQHRKPCGGQFLKKVKGCFLLSPSCLLLQKHSLQDMLKRPDFYRKCEEWRTIEQPPGTYSDIYDADIWKEFLIHDGVLGTDK